MFLLQVSILLTSLGFSAPDADSPQSKNDAPLSSQATNPEDRSGPGDALLQKALQHEVEGDFLQRQNLLERALELEPDHAPSSWHLGKVRFRGRWLTPDEVAEQARTDRLLRKYQKSRLQFRNTPKDHFNLSRWCRRHGLKKKERAHLLVAVVLAPRDAKLQRALGHRQFMGRWMSEDEISRVIVSTREAIDGYVAWKARLRKLRNRIETKSSPVRSEARDELLALRDPLAITALEEMVSSRSEEMGGLAVEILSQIPHQEANWSLIRHAIWSEWQVVRGAAIDTLREREARQYIPALIEYLRPARSDEIWVRLGDGRPVSVWYWQDFGMNNFVVADMRTVNQFDTLQPVWDEMYRSFDQHPDDDWHKKTVRRLSAAYGLKGMKTVAQIRDAVVDRGLATAERDNRTRFTNALAALEQLTGQQWGVDHHTWRTWWAEENHQYYDPSSYRELGLNTHARTNENYNLSSGHCFAASTPVWTRRGPVSIDRVQLGDLVLSVNPDTGELAYRPVVGSIVRPRAEIVHLHVGGKTIGATLGHPVWVSGKGWVRVKDLKAGDPMRGCGESHSLDSTKQGEEVLAYNLRVAEFHTYFVGESKILVHDNTPITDSLLKVPGLKQRVRQSGPSRDDS